MKTLRPEDFKKFFTSGWRLTGLNASFILGGSCGKGDLLVIATEKVSDVFINREKEKQCLQAGVELYGDESLYQKYLSEFKAYVEEAQRTVIPKYKAGSEALTKQEFEKDVNFIARLWDYYGYLEFPYMDLAYEVAQRDNNTAMTQRLEEASRYKFTARELMGKYFFVDGAMGNICTLLSKQFSCEYSDVLFYDELLALFDGARVDEKTAAERRECYATAIVDGKVAKFDFDEAKRLSAEFTCIEEAKEFKGITACKGVARGIAVVVPMMNDHDVVRSIDARMKKGDILVAETTSPDIMMLCKKAGAIVADQGGMLSHAAVVSRELNIPCIIGTERATALIKNGDMLEVDADSGIVKIVERA